MKLLSNINKNKRLLEIFFICIAILLYLFRTSIPFIKYPFILVYCCFIIYILCVYSERLRMNIIEFITHYALMLIILLSIFIAFFSSNKIFLSVTKDIINNIILLSFFFFLSILNFSQSDLKLLFNNLLNLIIIFALVTSFYNILSILIIYKNEYFIIPLYQNNITYYDNNFALLPTFFGFFVVFYNFYNSRIVKNHLYYNFVLLIFTFHIFLSGSRRGFILFSVLIVLIIILKIRQLFNEKILNNTFRKLFNIYFLTLSILFIVTYIFIFHTSSNTKNTTLKILGSKNITEAKRNICVSTYKCLKLFNYDLNYLDYYNSFWFSIDPKDPDSGWGSRVHKTIFPLIGNNVIIVPNDAKGYLLDSTSNPSYDRKYNICESYTNIVSLNVKEGERYLFSAFCNVNNNYNGDDVSLSIYGNGIKNKIFYRYNSDNYDLSKKGYWQKLELYFDCVNGEVNFCLGFIKKDISDFSTLKGTVVFAYPQFNKINKPILISKNDPRDPDTGWGTRTHKTIYPLFGKNVEIVPHYTKGYLMDSTCNSSYYIQSNICESYTKTATINVENNQKYYASVFCFVSEDFDGNDISLLIYGSGIKTKLVGINGSSSYDLLKKGYWQKLELSFDCKDGEVNICLSFIKKNVKDFSSLKGYVIFAFPYYYEINNQDSILTYSSWLDIKINANLFPFQKDSIFIDNFQVSKETRNDTYQFSSKMHFYNFSNYTNSSFCSFPLFLKKIVSLTTLDRDPIKNWIAKFINEDTTYYPYKTHIEIDTVSNQLSKSRFVRWQFAWQIFAKESNWSRTIFGGGFNHLNWFGYYFLKDKTKSDWPHNPFLSVLLYSGIIGLILYIFFLYKVFYYYIKYIKEYPLLFIFFIITFFFSFFSGGSPFDPPIMGFFVMLPFFIHYVHKKNETELS